MSKANSYAERLAELKGNFGEQVKEIIMPVIVDLACGGIGWYAGKKLGQKSLLVGLGLYVAGRFHGLHMAMKHEEQREATEKMKSKDGRLSKLIGNVYGENRVYYGDSPLSTIGMSMMVGGAVASSLGATEKQGEVGTWQEMKNDLKHRLYLDSFFNTKEEGTQSDKDVKGIGEIEYFLAGNELTKGLNLSELDKLDKQMEEEALRFRSEKSVAESPYQTKADSFSGLSRTDEYEAVTATRIL